MDAVRVAGLDSDLAAMPRGIATVVGERGMSLSGGQKQRVTIARALIYDAPVLVLDDALASVDTETERMVLQNLTADVRGADHDRGLASRFHRARRRPDYRP